MGNAKLGGKCKSQPLSFHVGDYIPLLIIMNILITIIIIIVLIATSYWALTMYKPLWQVHWIQYFISLQKISIMRYSYHHFHTESDLRKLPRWSVAELEIELWLYFFLSLRLKISLLFPTSFSLLCLGHIRMKWVPIVAFY